MKLEIPFRIGDHIYWGGKSYKIRGVHVYIKNDQTVESWRIYVGGGKFIKIKTNLLKEN